MGPPPNPRGPVERASFGPGGWQATMMMAIRRVSALGQCQLFRHCWLRASREHCQDPVAFLALLGFLAPSGPSWPSWGHLGALLGLLALTLWAFLALSRLSLVGPL